MTRILALADTQLGVATVPLTEQARVLHNIATVALERKADVVIHGGDVFEGATILPEQLRVFMDFVNRLHAKQIPIVVLRGNGRHDLATRQVHGLDIFNDVGVIVCDRPKLIEGRMLKDLKIVALPWVHPGRLIASYNGDVDHDIVNRQAANLLVRIARDLRPEMGPSVLAAHWAISGSALPTGLPVDEMREPILPWAELDALGYDVVVGAHVHEPQRISDSRVDKTLGIVVGSPQQLNFGEKGEHGCWIIEVGDHGPTDDRDKHAEFIPIDSPRFVTLDYDPASFNEPEIMGEAEVRQGDYVRVRFTATEDDAKRVDHEAIRRDLANLGAANVRIEPQIVRTARARAEGISEQLSQVEALVQWCDANEVGPEMQHRMIGRFQEWE